MANEPIKADLEDVYQVLTRIEGNLERMNQLLYQLVHERD